MKIDLRFALAVKAGPAKELLVKSERTSMKLQSWQKANVNGAEVEFLDHGTVDRLSLFMGGWVGSAWRFWPNRC